MSKKKVSRRLAVLGSTICLAFSIFICPTSTLPVQAVNSSDSTIQPYKDDIQWRWKVENNKLYKRLFNYSTADWVGDWIYVRDLP